MRRLERILLVEDEPDIQVIARLALESVSGCTVETCSSGAEAIERAPSFRPDVILLDVMMPDMDGPTTLRRLRRDPGLATTPVIFVTAKVREAEIESYRRIGAAGVIAKPFDPLTLADTVRETLDADRDEGAR